MAGRTPQGRIPELDGLRGAAILAVWLGHYFGLPAAGPFRILDANWYRLGWTGVDLFFVLSGFLIGGILLGARDSPAYFKTFYARRFFRIIPIYYVWTLAYVLVVGVGGNYLRAHARIGVVEGVDFGILAQFLFLQNFGNWLTSPLSYWWFGATWSLAVEEQFYLIAPLLVRFFSKRTLVAALTTTFFAAPFIRFFVRRYAEHSLDEGYWLAYRLMPCRADALAVGMLLGIAWRNAPFRKWLDAHGGLLYSIFFVLLAGVAILWRWFSNPQSYICQVFGYSWLALFFATVLVLALSKPAGPIAVLARLGFLRDLGSVSYCIYIVHTAIYLICFQILLHTLPTAMNGKILGITILAAAISYVIAKLSGKYFEGPMLRLGHAYKF